MLHTIASPDVIASSTIGAVTGLSLATGSIPLPEGLPGWVQWAGAAALTFGPILLKRILAAYDARTRALTDAKRRKAAALHADTDPTNDKAADALEAEADKLDADLATAHAILGGPTPTPPASPAVDPSDTPPKA